jgi:hypothetical protein
LRLRQRLRQNQSFQTTLTDTTVDFCGILCRKLKGKVD